MLIFYRDVRTVLCDLTLVSTVTYTDLDREVSIHFLYIHANADTGTRTERRSDVLVSIHRRVGARVYTQREKGREKGILTWRVRSSI